jgi:serine/threonine protein kinase
MVRHHFGKGSPELARFQVEAETIARLQHPNIVQVFQVGLAEDMPFLAMEFLDGGSLGNRLKSKKMTPHKAASLVETLARAMHLAHSRNVVHRDLKPANVLLAKDGTPKIADFGLARQLDVDSGQTHTGAIMGTPSYMAPEQASGETHRAGPAADVYALGAILYECLTGRPPFKGANIAETLEQVCNNEPRRPSVVNASVPIDLETICLKCLRKEPEHRYSSAEALADDVNRFLGDEPIEARPVGTSERIWRWCRRKPALAITSASAILGVMLAIVVLASAVIVVSDSLDKQTIERKKAETIGAQYKALAKKEENSRVEAEKQRDAAKLHFLKTS